MIWEIFHDMGDFWYNISPRIVEEIVSLCYNGKIKVS